MTTAAPIADLAADTQPLATCLALTSLRESPTNPRRTMSDALLAQLVDTIRAHGVLQPILVRPCTSAMLADTMLGDKAVSVATYEQIHADAARDVASTPLYEIVAGHRRYRASLLAGVADIPAIVRALDDKQVLEIQVIENLQREDVHPLEEADGYRRLTKQHGYTIDALAEKIGKSREYIFARMKLLDLSEASRIAWMAPDSELTASTALLIARIPHDLQAQALKDIIRPDWKGGSHPERVEDKTSPLSHRAAAAHIRRNYMLPIAGAPFDVADATYSTPSKNKNGPGGFTPIGPGCSECPKRTHAAKDLFRDVQGQDMCTDPGCYNAKAAVETARVLAAAIERGQKVITGKEARALIRYEHSDPDGYVDPAEKFWTGEKHIDVRKALGKELPITFVENPFTKKVQQVVAETDLKRLLKAKGLLTARSTGSKHADEQKANEKKAQLETQVRLEILRETIRPLHGLPLDQASLLMVADTCWRQTGEDNRRRLGTIYGWNKEERDDIAPRLAKMARAELESLLIACSLVGYCYQGTYNVGAKCPAELIAAAERAGVDHAAVRAEVVGAAKTKAKPAKKAAKKAAPADAKKAAKTKRADASPTGELAVAEG